MQEIDTLIEKRKDIYGPPAINLSCTGRLKSIFWEYANKNEDLYNNPIVMAACDELLTKIGRIATGKPHVDNFDDILGYTIIAKDHYLL